MGNSSGSTLKPTAADVKPDIRQAVLDYINPKTSKSGLDLLKNRHKEYKVSFPFLSEHHPFIVLEAY